MHISMFSSIGGGGDTLGMTVKTVTALGNLTDDFGTIMSKFEGTPRGFGTQNCVTWVGNYTPIFSK